MVCDITVLVVMVFLHCRCLAQSKQCVSQTAVESEGFTSEVSRQMDTSISKATESMANQQSTIQHLNTILNDNVSTSMEVHTCVSVRVHTCVCVYNTAPL